MDKRIEGYCRENAAGEYKAAKTKRKTVNSHERTGTGHIKIRVRRKIVQTGRTL